MTCSDVTRHGLLAAALLLTAGCASLDVARVRDLTATPEVRADAARALKDDIRDPRATEALIAALSDCSPTVRYFAADALADHLLADWYHRPEPESLRRGCMALVDRLSDDGVAASSWHLVWWKGTYSMKRLGPVRYRAAATLCAVLGVDHGFDAAAWRNEVGRRTQQGEKASEP